MSIISLRTDVLGLAESPARLMKLLHDSWDITPVALLFARLKVKHNSMLKKASRSTKPIRAFNLKPGFILAEKYEVLSKLGGGWQGEVYKIQEVSTGIERAAKLFYPQRNLKNKASDVYANKLHKLRECQVLIQYHAHESICYENIPITVLISEFVEGELLSVYLEKFRQRRLPFFQGIHLLHALAVAIECIHHHGEYHGDMHEENILVRRLGLSYELKLIDLFHWGRATRANRQEDICNVIRIFYDAIGGRKYYSKASKEARSIICGLKRSLILKKFPSASDLRIYLESASWEAQY
jgi:tRNA A-37 threonylcarbamoyl transferase component Bud32